MGCGLVVGVGAGAAVGSAVRTAGEGVAVGNTSGVEVMSGVCGGLNCGAGVTVAAGLGGSVGAAVGVGLGAGATVAGRVGEGVGVGPGVGVVGEGVATTEADNVKAGDGRATAAATVVEIVGAGVDIASDSVHPTIIAASVHSNASMRNWFKVFPLVPCPRSSQHGIGLVIPAFPQTAS